MDLHLIDALPTAKERGAIDEVVGPPDTGWEGGPRSALDGHMSRGGQETLERRHLLLPALHALQRRVGWISEGGLGYLCRRLSVPPAEAYGVASFYALLSTEPRPPTVVHVCDDVSCRVRGAKELCAELESRFGAPGTSPDGGSWTWMPSPCLGLCDRAPAALVQNAPAHGHDVTIGFAKYGDVWAEAVGDDHGDDPPHWHRETILGEWTPRTASAIGHRTHLLRRVGLVDPTSLDDYRAHGGYEALRIAFELGPEGVIREVKDAKLLGRGGAAFPTGVKWEAVARQSVRPHYFVCNADESEPGTFKDRVLTEEDPCAVVEALTIAGYATRSEGGYVYLRGEYPLAAERLQDAIQRASMNRFLGADVLG